MPGPKRKTIRQRIPSRNTSSTAPTNVVDISGGNENLAGRDTVIDSLLNTIVYPGSVLDMRKPRSRSKRKKSSDKGSSDDGYDDEVLMPPPEPVTKGQTKLVYQSWTPDKNRHPVIRNHVCGVHEREAFLCTLAEALLQYGAPPHRITSILHRAAQILETEMELFLFGSAVFITFGNQTVELKISGGTNLEMMAHVQAVFRSVIHDEYGADRGSVLLKALVRQARPQSLMKKVLCAFACSAAIGPVAFGSSVIDMWFGAFAGALLVYSQGIYNERNPNGAGMFRIAAIIAVSLFARGLATVPGNHFCYEAISSTGVVMILPGYGMLTAVLELMTGTTISGAIRLIDTLWSTLTLSFSLTIGSKILVSLVPASKRALERTLASQFVEPVTFVGVCTAPAGNIRTGLTGGYDTFDLAVTYTNNSLMPQEATNIVQGCLRDPSWNWWNRAFPWWTLFFFVPLFSLFISISQNQPIWSKNMAIMVGISCVSFAANTVVTTFVFKHGDLVSIVGAFVVGVLAHLYSRVWKGSAFCVSITGVLFLVPSGLSDSGGFASYSDSRNGYLMNSVVAGIRMIKVTALLALGLQLATWIVYLFGKNKKGTYFAL